MNTQETLNSSIDRAIMLDACIIIPIHNAFEYAAKTIEFIAKNYQFSPLIIVDDCSTEPITPRTFPAYDDVERLWIVRNERQQLFSRTVNRGIRKAHSIKDFDYYFIVNSDCQFVKDPLENLIKPFFEDDLIGITGYTDSPREAENPITEVFHPNFITGHCLCIKSDVFKQCGVMNETDYGQGPCRFPELTYYKGLAHIGSDRDLCYRAQEAGFKTMYVNHHGLDHEAGKSWGHSLSWLSSFNLDPLWEPNDKL